VVWWLAPILWSSEAWVRVFALHYFLCGGVNARAGSGAGVHMTVAERGLRGLMRGVSVRCVVG
jgi:hypothetical protein